MHYYSLIGLSHFNVSRLAATCICMIEFDYWIQVFLFYNPMALLLYSLQTACSNNNENVLRSNDT